VRAPLRYETVRTVEEYLDKVAEFHALADATTNPALKKRYADLAECYSLLAAERQRLIEQGAIVPD
jgi:hypothetical protein